VLTDTDETTREYLGMIKNEISDADRIVGDLLDSVRTRPPQPQSATIRELIEMAMQRCVVPEKVEVRLEIPEMLSRVEVDPPQMQQVFRNLIANAVDAMPEGGDLIILAREDKEGETIAVVVRDSGIGMTEEQQARLFQPLFTTKARGIGLGLVVVKNLTEANGGAVEVESVAGQGTVFTVSLPVKAGLGDESKT
jgi:signal transduction histidine kinase